MSNIGSWELNAELQSVNDIMAAIGEAPVQTLEGDTNVDVVNARRLLHTVNRQIQSRGWSFNIEKDAVLTPDVFSNLIVYQPQWLSVVGSTGQRLTNRAGYLYDSTARTDIFTGNVTATMIILREFDEMPVPFQTLIVARAAKIFNSRFFGAPELVQDLSNAEGEANQYAMEWELDYAADNCFSSDPFISSAIAR